LKAKTEGVYVHYGSTRRATHERKKQPRQAFEIERKQKKNKKKSEGATKKKWKEQASTQGDALPRKGGLLVQREGP